MKTFAIAALLVAGLASPALAGQIATGSFGPYQSGLGGEYTFQAISGIDTSAYSSLTKGFLGGDTFQSFCLEASEYIYENTTYDAEINTSAMYGSVGPSGDPLSKGTGYLYSEFAKGTLQGYAYTGTAEERKASADALQRAIWWLEQEKGGQLNDFYTQLLRSVFGSGSGARGGSAADYGVYALNLTSLSACAAADGRCQDTLYYTGQRVPDGGITLMLLGGALVSLGAVRRFTRRG